MPGSRKGVTATPPARQAADSATASGGGRTNAALVAHAAERLARAGLSPADARRDAGVLIRHVLGWDPATWLTRSTEPADAGVASRFEDAVARRLARVPVSQITGAREFYGRPFIVTADVLSPRPETEIVVEEALRVLGVPGARGAADAAAGRPPLVADAGTGSGCLAVTIALERPDVRVIASDLSGAALAVARRNVEAHGVADRVLLVRANLIPPTAALPDLVVSNPPYVPDRDRAALAPEVRDHEPPGALFGGPDGLDVVRALVTQAATRLAPGGHLVVEIGAGQADEARRAAEAHHLEVLRLVADLQRIPRVLVARRVAGDPLL